MKGLTISENRKIASALGRMKCRTHGERPKITPTSKGISVECCCEKFKTQLLEEYQNEAGKILQKQIEQDFKKILRK